MMMLFLYPHSRVSTTLESKVSPVDALRLSFVNIIFTYISLFDPLVSKHHVRMNCAAGSLHKNLVLTSPARCAETDPHSAQNLGHVWSLHGFFHPLMLKLVSN